MVTLKQIADEVGVSIRTVSIALNGDPMAGRISETCVQQIQKIASKRGYKVSAAARAIRMNRTYQIGVLVRNNPLRPMIDPASYETIMGINQQMEKAGYIVSLIRFTDVNKQFASQSRVFRERVLDGLIGIGNIPQHCTDIICQAVKTCIWVDCNFPNLPYTISRDEFQAGRLAAHHARLLGYRNVYWTGMPNMEADAHMSVRMRFDGVTQRLAEDGIPLNIQPLPRWYPNIDVHELAQSFKPQNVFIAYNNEIATNLSQLASSLGYRVGRDFGLLCCEDSGYIHDNWPGLSRASFDRFQMGKAAADLMLDLLPRPQNDDPKNLTLPVHWLPGNTAWGPGTTA
jgi:DNA-binding LacI/PurR family transcriptional regulator